MAELKNPRHEEFAQKIAAGLSTSKAYEAAGFPADRSNAARLKKKLLPRIREVENATVRMITLIERRANELTTVRLAKAASRIAILRDAARASPGWLVFDPRYH